MSVPRGTLERLCRDYGLDECLAAQLERLLAALADEPDPPTTVRSPPEAAEVHVADSLAALELPPVRLASAIADIGSGVGFPALALAAALPGARVDALEAAARKCAVIERLARAAQIENANAIPARAEEWAAADGRDAYDVVTARAVAPLAVLAEYAAPLLARGGLAVFWKGARDQEEERAGAAAAERVGLRPAAVVPVTPYPKSRNRHLHTYRKAAPTPAGFPRRAGIAAKRPLA